MRLFDAVSALKPQKHKKTTVSRMTTIWSQQIDPGSVLPEYPRPQFRRENWICLNGPWDYTFTKKSKRPERPDGQILVPFSPECLRSGVSRQLRPGEYLWYFRFVYLNAVPENQRLLLHFGAVDQRCSVWWNGHCIADPQLRNVQLEHAWAMTVHKSQGSEYRAVVLALAQAAPRLLTRGVLYTAVTRARELLIAVGDGETAHRMIDNHVQSRRYSGLRLRLCSDT